MGDEVDARRLSKVARALARSKNISDKTTRSLVGHTMKLHASNSVEQLHKNHKTLNNISIGSISSGQSLSFSWAGFATNKKENPLSQSAPVFTTVLVDEEAKPLVFNSSIMDDSIGTGSLQDRSRLSSQRSSRRNSRVQTPYRDESSPLPFFRPDSRTPQLESTFDISTAGSSRDHLIRSPELTSAQSQVEIDCNYLPANYLKENMIQVLRKHDLISRSPVVAASVLPTVKKGDHAFNDSLHSSTVNAPSAEADTMQPPSTDDDNISNRKRIKGVKSPLRAQKPGPRILPLITPKRIITPADVNASVSYRSLLSSTYRSKINSIIHIEDDYAAKWMRMKDKRDVIRSHEEEKLQGKELEHFFRRLQINMEKHEKQQLLLGDNSTSQVELEQRRKAVLDRHHQHEELYLKRKERLLIQKNQEAQEFKQTINKSINNAKRLQRRDNHSRRSLLLDELSFELDDATSTMIDIPPEMNERLRAAKSLLSYQAAKKEIKDYHDSIFLQRLSRLSESKERARQRTEAFP